MRIYSLLERAVALQPGAPAIREDGETLDWAECGARVRRLARFLSEHGLARGERIAILEWNSGAFLIASFAAAGLGAVLVPLNVRLAPVELAEVLERSGARWLIAGAGLEPLALDCVSELARRGASLAGTVWCAREPAPASEGAQVAAFGSQHRLAAIVERGEARFEPVDTRADELAQLYFTSGTTGRPKGVMLTHGNICTHALAAIAELGLDGRDRWGHFAPMFHLADAWAIFAITWVGGLHVMQLRFEAARTLATIERERVTITNLIPSMLNTMVQHPRAAAADLSSMRRVLSGGAPIAPEVVRAVMRVFGCEYVQTYGMTETAPYLTLSLLHAHLRELPEEQRFRFRAKTGRPFLTVELEVRGEDGQPVPRNGVVVGEICVRGPTVTPGYWRDPEATAAAFERGWLKTGDLATLDAEGYVEIVDRKKDMIITGGEKVYTTEVEAVLYAHASVLEAAVFGLPDERWGEAVCAAIVLRERCSATPHELEQHCRAQLAGYKVPRHWRFLAELPRTGSGKISKLELRELPLD